MMQVYSLKGLTVKTAIDNRLDRYTITGAARPGCFKHRDRLQVGCNPCNATVLASRVDERRRTQLASYYAEVHAEYAAGLDQ